MDLEMDRTKINVWAIITYTERFSSEKEHQRTIEALSKDLDAVKQGILDDSISVKIYPENE